MEPAKCEARCGWRLCLTSQEWERDGKGALVSATKETTSLGILSKGFPLLSVMGGRERAAATFTSKEKRLELSSPLSSPPYHQ